MAVMVNVGLCMCSAWMCGSLPKKSAYPHFVTPSSAFVTLLFLVLPSSGFHVRHCSRLFTPRGGMNGPPSTTWSLLRGNCLSVCLSPAWLKDRRPSVSGSEKPHPPPIFISSTLPPARRSTTLRHIVNFRHRPGTGSVVASVVQPA